MWEAAQAGFSLEIKGHTPPNMKNSHTALSEVEKVVEKEMPACVKGWEGGWGQVEVGLHIGQ